ncbi:hypothetical protein TRAPUB_13769 [Trametes pubescens]|uniref:Phosphoglycerate mutase-like protein n=1 Tax=Trametes pubescens TaxID=154538 RepID=A0A1M2VQA5_TRAPU|nr:hypothetical protein TRAPUB_13769 [Trametes pubescens]
MTVVVRVYLVRHGETDDNRQGIMQGQRNTPLNSLGAHQSRLVADALTDVPFGAAHTSDLARARKTAEIVLEKHPGVTLETSQTLRERFLGDWQGRSGGERGEPGTNIESETDFVTRAVNWWNDSISRIAQRESTELQARASSEDSFAPAHVLVVTHSALIDRLVDTLTKEKQVRVAEGVDYHFKKECPKGSISIVEIEEDGRGVLVSYADTTHLKDIDLVQKNADVQ